MRKGQRLLATFVAFLMATGCASTPKIPVHGRSVTVIPDGDAREAKGELLVVGPERLWIRERGDVVEVSLREVREVRVKRHGSDGRKALTLALGGGLVTGGLLAGACSSVEGSSNCGVVGLVVAGAWLLVGALAAPSMEASSRLDLWKPTPEQLRPFARLPQGLPAGLAPRALAPDPDGTEAP